jgi:hypothetical protein
MHVPIKVKSPNNISKWQMGFNSVFKGLTKTKIINKYVLLVFLFRAHNRFTMSHYRFLGRGKLYSGRCVLTSRKRIRGMSALSIYHRDGGSLFCRCSLTSLCHYIEYNDIGLTFYCLLSQFLFYISSVVCSYLLHDDESALRIEATGPEVMSNVCSQLLATLPGGFLEEFTKIRN